MTKVIAIANQKGGVGKTSTTVNLGAGLVRQGYAVLAIDFDPQANLTMALGFKSPDDMEYTVSNVLAKAMDEEPIDPAEGILTTEEGVDLMPSSIQLSRYELSLVNEMNRESIMVNIHEGIKGIAYGLLVLFFVVGVARTTTNFSEIKRPEQALKLFLRFAIAKAVVTYSMELMQSIFRIIQGILTQVSTSAGSIVTGGVELPDSVIYKIESCGFFESIPLWLVSLIGALIITVLSCVLLLTVYSRFFKLYMYTAVAPIPMSSFAGEGTAQVGRTFLKSYAGVCLQGAIIILACIIYSVFAESAPMVDEGASAASAVWSYLLELILNMLVLVGAVRMSDRIIHEMIGM